MRDDYGRFQALDAEIVCVGTDDMKAFQYYWNRNKFPYIGLPDPKHHVVDLYGQQVKLLKFGRMPALFVIDKAGIIQYAHYADSMSDIPSNQSVLAVLERINEGHISQVDIKD